MKTTKQIKEELEKELEKEQKKCVSKAWDKKKNDWNPEHFKYCEADVIKKKIDQHKETLKARNQEIKEIVKKNACENDFRKCWRVLILNDLGAGNETRLKEIRKELWEEKKEKYNGDYNKILEDYDDLEGGK